jgi:hypothetical protein
MKHQECKTAIVEFGYDNKDEYVFIKGASLNGQRMLAHTYWYPEDITNDEANQEIADLCEFYENVVIVLPIPAQLHLSKEARNE